MKTCPHCEVNNPNDAIFCKKCGKEFGKKPDVSDSQTKKCPYCAEDINAEAIICSYCDSNLTNGEQSKKQKTKISTPEISSDYTTLSVEPDGTKVFFAFIFLVLTNWAIGFFRLSSCCRWYSQRYKQNYLGFVGSEGSIRYKRS